MTAPTPPSAPSFPTARVLAALGTALAPLVALAVAAPAIRTPPLYAAALSFTTAALAIVLHTARAPLSKLATPSFALRLAPPGLLFGLLGSLVVSRLAPHSAFFEVLSSTLNSAGVLLLGTSAGALVGWRVLHAGHLTAVALASSAADLWSVLAPEGVTHHVVAAAVEQRDPAFLRLLTVSAAVPPDRTGEPAIGLGDVAFCALYLAVVTKHGASRSRATAALALGLVSAADFDRWVDPAAMTRPDGPPG